ncbi:MAG: extensin family protein [Roseibium sp.]
MRLPVLVLILVGFGLQPEGLADSPLPKAKPMTDSSMNTFIEGVDVPAGKPGTDEKSIVPKTEAAGVVASCVLPLVHFEKVESVSGQTGCGFENAIRMTAVDATTGRQVRLSTPATISCGFAEILSTWLVTDVIPASETYLGDSLAEITTGPGYQCRRRNNKPDGKLSEHALGTAIDIAGFRTLSGGSIDIETNWVQKTDKGLFLKEIHKAACKRFTTVLGPDADPNHKSHFHLDIGCHGKDCTYLICQ